MEMRMRPHALNPGQGELMTKKAWGSRKWDPFPLDRLWTKIWGTCSEASARSASIKNDSLNNGGLATNPFYPAIAFSLRMTYQVAHASSWRSLAQM